MPKKRDSCYSERDSPFFRLRSKSKLASLLFISLEKLKALASADDLYFEFKKPKSSGGIREISARGIRPALPLPGPSRSGILHSCRTIEAPAACS